MNMKRILSAALVLAMLVGLVPGAGVTAKATGDETTATKTITQTNTTATMAVSLTVPEKSAVSYIDANGEEKQTGTDYNNVRATIVKWGTVDTETWWVVDEDVTIAERIAVNGTVNLILCDGATLTANKGITFASNEYSLTVYGQTKGTGALVAAGGSGQAGIGGGDHDDDVGSVGTVTINGGTVTATGGENAAGIGGGIETDGRVVTINGGTVTATGGNKGAGIGGGVGGAGGMVTIKGGTVTATGGGGNAAGIGRGKNGSGNGSLTIGTGMQVKAGAAATEEIIENATFTGNPGNYKWACIGIFHTHNFGTSYALSTTNATNDTITAVCDNADGECTLPLVNNNHTATLTIAPKDDGTATLTGGADFGVSDTNIKYYSRGESNSWVEIPDNGKPSGDGFFKASITVGEGENAKTAEVKYGVNEVKKISPFDATEAHGDFEVPETATIGATVSIVTTPADGYQLKGITATKADSTSAENVGKDSDNSNTGTFTMPNSEVTVSAEFEKRNVGVKLVVDESVVAEPAKESCTAALLTTEYNATEAGFTRTLGQKFILRVDSDEAYSFTITGSTDDFNFTALSASDKKAYVSAHEDADENTQLFEVTMPAVAFGNLTVRVTFLKIKNYTVLYQPGVATDTVWCKIGSGNKSFQLKMNPDAQMGNVKTFALNVSMTSDPQKIAFGTAELADNAEMKDVSVKKNATDAGAWQTVTGSNDKFLVIGGTARTVIAAFTPNNNTVNAADVKSLPAGTQYRIAVCGVGQAGTVTAPAAPNKEGYTFAGWGYMSEPASGKDTYDAGAPISIKDDAIFGAVWTPATSTVTINLKGGDIAGETDNVTISEVQYNKAILGELQKLLPQKNGFALDGWTVNKSVTEGGKFFSRGSDFDPNTNITSNLELNAKWKHVHSYTCVPLNYVGFGDALKDYYGYLPYIHVRFCGCGDVELEAHTFRNGVCTGCGATKGGENPVTLDVSYWKDGAQWMSEVPRTGLKKNEEVTVSAFYQIGNYKFSKWEYSTNGSTWHDLAATTLVGFLIPCDMQVRALYTLVEVQPQVSLSASKYVTEAQGYNWDTVLFQMEYKLPKNCTYVDAGVRMGDNQGISFYSLKKRKVSAFETAFNFITSDPISFAVDQLTSDPDYIIEKREDNVLGTMNAATLAKYMMENKPINIPEYEPIYWQANPATKSRSGSVNTLTPLRFIQKNNGNHYIYGVAYLRFKDSNNVEHTIYTDAIPVTRNTIPEKNTDTATYDTSN